MRPALPLTSDGGIADAHEKPRIDAGFSSYELSKMVTTLAANTFRDRFNDLRNT